MITNFDSNNKTKTTQVIYLPGNIAGNVVGQMRKSNAIVKTTDVDQVFPNADLFSDMPAEIKVWEDRLVKDGNIHNLAISYVRIESNYSAEYIYAYAKQFFGPTIDPDYKTDMQNAIRENTIKDAEYDEEK